MQRAATPKALLTTVFLLACLQTVGAQAQQPAPQGVDSAIFAAKRFPQAVRVGDLLHRIVLEPTESRSVLGRVVMVIRQDDGSKAIVIDYGGVLGLGSRPIAVPLHAMVLLGVEMEVLDLTTEQLRDLPTYGGAGQALGVDEIIRVGLAHPSH